MQIGFQSKISVVFIFSIAAPSTPSSSQEIQISDRTCQIILTFEKYLQIILTQVRLYISDAQYNLPNTMQSEQQHHSEDLHIVKVGTKQLKYQSILEQIYALVNPNYKSVSNAANIVAALKQQFNWWWVGFYYVDHDQLYLGPFQGPVACIHIKKGKGVCGASWQRKQTIVVEDVEKFPGHIACSSASKSEIVVPVIRDGEVIGVLDVDSEHLAHFDEIDKRYLEQLINELVVRKVL